MARGRDCGGAGYRNIFSNMDTVFISRSCVHSLLRELSNSADHRHLGKYEIHTMLSTSIYGLCLCVSSSLFLSLCLSVHFTVCLSPSPLTHPLSVSVPLCLLLVFVV